MTYLRQHKLRAAGFGAVIILLLGLLGIGLANKAGAALTGSPAYQTGAVHSCPPPYGTNGQAAVTTSDGGQTWYYNGGPGSPSMQYGVVHSFTTGGNANVLTFSGGQVWQFHNNGGPLYCSPPR